MRLSRRDAFATMFVAIALGIYLAWALGLELPGFGAVGGVALAVLVLGVVASASAVVPDFDRLIHGSRVYVVVASALGLLALAAGMYSIIAGEAAALTTLVLATIAMWAMATARHATLPRPAERLRHR
jgi:hypothetical protein